MQITRKQYGQLVDGVPSWMAKDWLELKRNWSLYGVKVEGTPGQIKQLAALVEMAEQAVELERERKS